MAVVQRFLPHYRVGFFESLQRRLALRGGELRVLFSHTMGHVPAIPAWATQLMGLRVDKRMGELDESVILAPRLPWQLAHVNPDVVIAEDLGGLPNSLLCALYCRRRSIPYLIWGLGRVPNKERSPLRRALSPAINFLYGGASGFVGYSTYAARVYEQYAKPTLVAPNSFLPRPDAATYDERVAISREKARTNKLNIVTIGTLKAQKRCDVLVRAVAGLSLETRLHIIGDGPERPALQALAVSLGVASRVSFHGALYGADKSALLANANLGVVPGRGGLAIQELLAHGIPVISGVADGTEQDLVKDGKNGYLLDGFPSSRAIAERIAAFRQLSNDEREAMALAAIETVMREHNIECMADRMATAAEQAWRR